MIPGSRSEEEEKPVYMCIIMGHGVSKKVPDSTHTLEKIEKSSKQSPALSTSKTGRQEHLATNSWCLLFTEGHPWKHELPFTSLLLAKELLRDIWENPGQKVGDTGCRIKVGSLSKF